ncbi:DUF397 domain-containing protein [Actinokineospora diospyrosa]|uniref:DUF397 domain-containing protein n=1 Tax=Actinokineospora diospyrosa TaxID=103728 RepID=A0ABT1IIF2_9PSEU|nr:DUF397 domain-containing protein [Actinokineospora diospyrosa]MCP2272026.1 protein of unknown function (DUF397) [Actinokineospora diospyrosa]
MTWRKSTRSNNGTDCVEVRSDLAAVRDSKNPTGAAISIDVRDLVRHLKG